MARKVLSAGASADARNDLVEIIETNCRGHWHEGSQPALAFPEQIASTGATHRYFKWKRVPTVATTELRTNSRTIHITQNWIGWTSRVRNKTYTMITLEGAVYTCVQTARFVANLIAHVGRIETRALGGRRLTMRSR